MNAVGRRISVHLRTTSVGAFTVRSSSSGEQSQPTEIVRNEREQPQSAEAVTGSVAQPQSPVSIDSLSKVLAVALVFLYVSEFLITSLHNFQYGFSEMNPLRPRILAAGGWFAIFIAVPFALVWELKIFGDCQMSCTK